MKDREIILVGGTEIEYDDGYRLLINTVGEWEKVTDEEFQILRRMSCHYKFQIIERNPPCKIWGKKTELRTVQDYLDEHSKEQKKAEEAAKKRSVDAAEKTLERKRKQLERLKKELEDK